MQGFLLQLPNTRFILETITNELIIELISQYILLEHILTHKSRHRVQILNYFNTFDSIIFFL